MNVIYFTFFKKYDIHTELNSPKRGLVASLKQIRAPLSILIKNYRLKQECRPMEERYF